MVEIAPAVVIAFFSAVAIVCIFACGYLYAEMRIDRQQAELAPAAPSRHAAGVARVPTIQPDTERGITPAVRFVVPVGRAA